MDFKSQNFICYVQLISTNAHVLKLLTRLMNLFYLSRKESQIKNSWNKNWESVYMNTHLTYIILLTNFDIDVHRDNCIEIRYSWYTYRNYEVVSHVHISGDQFCSNEAMLLSVFYLWYIPRESWWCTFQSK